MFCPQCGEEFSWDVMICPTCDVETVDRLPGPEPTPDVELVPILATGDPGVIAMARSLLEGEEIDYFVRGEGLQDLFGLGRITGFSFAMGPAQFLVRADDADRARALLDGLTTTDLKPDAPDEAS
jgi:Putative prokaryotic signal transducing protein